MGMGLCAAELDMVCIFKSVSACFTFHVLRHAVASLLFENGTQLADVTTQLGHGQTSTTERIYVHTSNIANVQNEQTLASAIGM